MQQWDCVVDWGRVTPPVRVAPGSICLVTAQAVCRMHRFAPKRRVVRMLDYCIHLAAMKFEKQIQLHEFLFMSNHVHLLLTDVAGVLPTFMQLLDSIISRNLNAIRGITGKNFEGYTAQIIEPDDHERQLRAAVYILNNPCAANLVSRCRHWRSTSSLALRYGDESVVKRPNDGIYQGTLAHLRGRKSKRSGRAVYARSKAPRVARLTLHPLPCPSQTQLPDRKTRARVLERLAAAEDELIVKRRRRGLRVLGWRDVVATGFNAMPRSSRELFDIQPTVAASTPEFRQRAEHRIRYFREAYYAARAKFLEGVRDVVFPYGTWLVVQRYKLPCQASAP